MHFLNIFRRTANVLYLCSGSFPRRHCFVHIFSHSPIDHSNPSYVTQPENFAPCDPPELSIRRGEPTRRRTVGVKNSMRVYAQANSSLSWERRKRSNSEVQQSRHSLPIATWFHSIGRTLAVTMMSNQCQLQAYLKHSETTLKECSALNHESWS